MTRQTDRHTREIASGERFEFGRNWTSFLNVLDDERIAIAERSLRDMLGMSSLANKTFVDVGSGSGLFSLAARRLGARVYSFDYDPWSVACTKELKRRYFPDDADWTVEQGSVLDTDYLRLLGQFEVVYSWGVLHHTGAMWQALANALQLARPGGLVFVAIYNDNGTPSRRWMRVKSAYNRLPRRYKFLVLWPAAASLLWRSVVKDVLVGRPLRSWRRYRHNRGMSLWSDVVDWVGGFPFEVAKPGDVFDFCKARGFTLQRLVTQGGTMGVNEFVFVRGENA